MAKSKQEIQREMRKEHARELRKAHFNLGFEEGFDDETRYREFYKWFDLEQAEKTKQEMLKLRNDLRSTHYVLGTDDPSQLYKSTASENFKQPVNPQMSQLSVETKNDLRSHHFNLASKIISLLRNKIILSLKEQKIKTPLIEFQQSISIDS